MAARPCITGKSQPPRAGAPAVQIMIMVEHPQRVQALDLRGIPLLPVNPPEINAFFFHGMKYRFKICFQELRIRHVKLYRVPAFRVDPHPPGDFRITFFIGADAVGRMKIQGRLHSVRVQPVHKLLRIREQGRVPGIAGPAAPVSGIHLLHQMPVHVNDRDRKRNPFLLKAFHKLFIFRLIIPVITAPPVAEHKAGQQRLLSAQMIESLQAIEISVSVSPEIEIDGFPAARRDRTVRQDRHGTGIVHHGKPGFRHQSGFQRDGSVRRIKGTGCAAQVTQFVPITPQPLRRTAARHADHQAARRKLLFIVMNLHRSRKDVDPVFVSGNMIVRCLKVTIQNLLRRPVLELAVFTVFKADQRFREDADAVVLSGNHRFRVGFRVCPDAILFHSHRYPPVRLFLVPAVFSDAVFPITGRDDSQGSVPRCSYRLFRYPADDAVRPAFPGSFRSQAAPARPARF